MTLQTDEERLIELLAGYGYQSEELEATIREGVEYGDKRFIARHAMAFGDEMMYCNFYLSLDWQFNAYRVKKMEATHHYPVKIETQNINGIDIPLLEEAMKSIEWTQVPFSALQQGKIPYKDVREIFGKLEALRKNEAGARIADLLYIKYLPEDYCAGERLMELRAKYINSGTFKDDNEQIPGINLSYHIVSGKLDRLYEKLNAAGFDDLADTYCILEKQFRNAPGNFSLDFTINKPEGQSILSCPILYKDSEYKASEYLLTYTPYPAIKHTCNFGVDTEELEYQMKSINRKVDAETDPLTECVFDKIKQLRKSPESNYIADILTLKYWMGNPDLEYLITPSAKKLLGQLPFFRDTFPISVRPGLALQLLKGKPVAGDLLYPGTLKTSEWIRLDVGKRNRAGHYPQISIDRLPETRMKNLLLPLNYEKAGFFDPLYLMRCGKTAEIRIDDKHYFLEAIPEQETFRMTDREHREIPFNFSLSPDWIPNALSSKELIKPPQEKARHSFQNKKTGIRKGKGL